MLFSLRGSRRPYVLWTQRGKVHFFCISLLLMIGIFEVVVKINVVVWLVFLGNRTSDRINIEVSHKMVSM